MQAGRSQAGRSRKMKYRLAAAMQECMLTTSVGKITVRQIVKQCGTTRQTFYRHFMDKYALINWYFEVLLHKSFEHMGSGRTILEGLTLKFEYILKERAFFTAAFRYDRQNSLKQHDFESIMAFYKDLIVRKSGSAVVEDTLFLLELYCYGSVYMTVKWVLEGMKEPPERMAQKLVEALPLSLQKTFIQIGLLD